ncbi:MAG TPA: hypothetical protein VFE58_18445 [Tepidisphaeraceae bacterium]|jgi:hypothetical protein|nr:hypothetical protein [Tepidisphaeraceae bacterium]
MQDIAFLTAVILIGVLTATFVGLIAPQRRTTSFVAAFMAAYLAMLASAYVFDMLGPSNWHHGHLYLPSNWLQFLGSLIRYKSPGLVVLSLLCLTGPAIAPRLRRIA